MNHRMVVVIEDDPVLRTEAAELFESAGLSVMSFSAGEEAIAFVQENPGSIAGIFTDVGLTGEIDGLKLAAYVSEAAPGVAIVVTSGAVLERPDHLSPNVRFLVKPWHPLDVINAMQDAELDDGAAD